MRTILWTLGWIGVAVWTLLALVGFGVLGFFGDLARSISGHVPGFPDELLSVPWLVELLQRTGGFALLLVWLAGAGLILAVPAIIGLFLPRRDSELRRRFRLGRHPAPIASPGPVLGPTAPTTHPAGTGPRAPRAHQDRG